MSGLRERKKQQTRQRISDIATGLFAERGFDAVSVAEVAEAAEVSVNTVYNYFPAKEDLFFDREDEVVQRAPRLVRERRPGQSAAEALLERMRQDVREGSAFGLQPRHREFVKLIAASPALTARRWRMIHRIGEALVAALREEAGAAEDDVLPELIAQQLLGLNGVVHSCVARGAAADQDPDRVAEEALRRLDVYESLLSRAVLDYCRR